MLTEKEYSQLLVEAIAHFISTKKIVKEKKEKLLELKNTLLRSMGPRKGEEIQIQDKENDEYPVRAVIVDVNDHVFEAIRIGDGDFIRFNLELYSPTEIIFYTIPNPAELPDLTDVYVVYPNGNWTVGEVQGKEENTLKVKVKKDTMTFEIPSGNGLGKWKSYKAFTSVDSAIARAKEIQKISEGNN